MLACRFLLDAALFLQFPLLGELALELIVAAAPEGQLLLVEMDDGVDGAVEQVAVVRDQKHGVRIFGDVVLQPQRAFEVEIVGRLVEQKKVWLGEEHGRQRDAHAPAAGERRGRTLLRGVVEAEAGQNGGGSGLRRMRVDVGKPRVDLGDAVRIRGRPFLFEQSLALGIGLEHDVDQRLLGARRFLRHLADAGVFGQADRAGLGGEIAGDRLEQGGLAGAVAADEPGLGAGRQGQRGMIEKQAPRHAQREVVDDKHGRAFARDMSASQEPGALGRRSPAMVGWPAGREMLARLEPDGGRSVWGR